MIIHSVVPAGLLMAFVLHAHALGGQSALDSFNEEVRPNKVSQPVSGVESFDTWRYHFRSLDDFISTVGQARFRLLKKEETRELMVAVFNLDDKWLIVATYSKDLAKSPPHSFSVRPREDHGDAVGTGFIVPLAITMLQVTNADGTSRGTGKPFLAWCAPVASDFAGYLDLRVAQNPRDSPSEKKFEYGATVRWPNAETVSAEEGDK